MADEDDSGANEGGEDGGGKRRIPIWVIALIGSQVVLVVAALVVFQMMSSSMEPEDSPDETASPGEQEVDPETGSVEDLVGPQYELDPFIVNLLDDGGGARYLKVDIRFELEEEDVAQELDSRLHQVRHELLILLSSKRQADIETAEGKRILRDEIYSLVNKLLVTGAIDRVYFTDFVIQ